MKTGIALLLAIMAGACAGCSDARSAQRHMERADAFLERGRYREAAIEYVGALRINPTNAVAMGSLGVAYARSGDIARAYPALRRALELDPSRADVKTRLAEILLVGGAPEEARILAGEVLDGAPDDLDALMVWSASAGNAAEIEESLARLLARRAAHANSARFHLALGALHGRKGDQAAAGASFAEALRLEPDSPDALMARAEWDAREGDLASARAGLERAYAVAPTSSLAGVRLAAFHRMTGTPAEARRVLDELLALSPGFAPALIEVASMDVAEQKYDNAAARIETLLAAEPGHVPARLLRVRTLVLQGRLEEAEKEVSSLMETHPALGAACVERARIRLRKGQVAEAERDLQEALKLAPNNMEAALALAELDVRRGRHEAAIARLLPLAREGTGSRVQALLLLGSAYRIAGRWSDAIDAYDALAVTMPDSPQPPYLAAMTKDAAKDVDGALAELETALRKAPAFVPAASAMVGLLMREGRSNEATARVDGWTVAHPDEAGFHYLRAALKLAAGDDAAAEESLKRTIAAAPQVSSAYMDLGRLYLRQGRVEDAMGRFRESASANPRDPVPHMMLAVMQQGRGRDEEAARSYEQAIDLAPNFVGALNNLAYLLASQDRDLDRAFALAQRARDLAPSDPAVADTLALVALKRKDYRWALALLEECAPQLASEPEVHYRLALARQWLGLEDGARDALRRALAMEKDFAGRDDARVLLSILDIPLREIEEPARARLEQAIGILPGNPSALVRLGRLDELAGNTTTAIARLEEAIANAPEFAPALIALTRMTTGDATRATAYGRRAREAAPRSWEAAHALGRAAMQAGDYPWARSVLLEGASLPGADAAIRRDLAEASLLCGRVDESRREAEQAGDAEWLSVLDVYRGTISGSRAAEILGSVSNPTRQSPAFRLASARVVSVTDAKAAYRALAASYPNWGLPWRELAALAVEGGEVDDEAVKAAREARARMPDDPAAKRVLGLALAKRDAFSEAIPLLEAVLRSAPKDGVAGFWLACSQGGAGDTRAAVASMERALAAGLTSDLAGEAARRLEAWRPAATP